MKSLGKFAIGLVSVLASAAAFEVPAARAETPDAGAARAQIQKAFGFMPAFLKEVPDAAIPGAWQELAALEIAPNTALPCKIKELIGLAVAAQIVTARAA